MDYWCFPNPEHKLIAIVLFVPIWIPLKIVIIIPVLQKSLSGEEKPSELLPAGWNADPTSFSLRYVNDGKLYLFKGLVADDDIVINLLVSWNNVFFL